MARANVLTHPVNGKVPASKRYSDRQTQIAALLNNGMSVEEVARNTWQGADTQLTRPVIDANGILSSEDNRRYQDWISYVRAIANGIAQAKLVDRC